MLVIVFHVVDFVDDRIQNDIIYRGLTVLIIFWNTAEK
jgi:hypothetical protein